MNKIVSFVLIALSYNVCYAKKSAPSGETCFLFVPFVKGGTVALQMTNTGHDAHRITVQPWDSNGSPLEKRDQVVLAGATTEMRVDVTSGPPKLGWFQVMEEGRTIKISATYEYLNGDTVTTIPVLAVFRHPLSESAVRSALEYSIHHRYTYDVFALRGVLYVFVNLSDYPVQAGLCQENYPDCVLPSLPYTVMPHASLVLPIDQQKRFLVMHSTPGYSVATAVEMTEGLQRIFAVNSSIRFGPVR
jgi:hypothetical protein